MRAFITKEEIEEIECIVTGRVQGVMFRDFVRRRARALGIVGTVENLFDGSVRVVAGGSPEVLAAFVAHLNRGPILARVDNVAVTRHPWRKLFSDFSIIL